MGTLPVADGGTVASTLSTGGLVVGAGTGAVTALAPGASRNVPVSNGSAWVSQAPSSGGSAPFSDATALVKNSSDATKLGLFSAAGITTGNTRTYNLPDGSGALNAEQFITPHKRIHADQSDGNAETVQRHHQRGGHASGGNFFL